MLHPHVILHNWIINKTDFEPGDGADLITAVARFFYLQTSPAHVHIQT